MRILSFRNHEWHSAHELKSLKEGRSERLRVYRRTHVVPKARQRQLGSAGAATDHGRSLIDAHSEPLTCHRHSSSESIGAAADHAHINLRQQHPLQQLVLVLVLVRHILHVSEAISSPYVPHIWHLLRTSQHNMMNASVDLRTNMNPTY